VGSVARDGNCEHFTLKFSSDISLIKVGSVAKARYNQGTVQMTLVGTSARRNRFNLRAISVAECGCTLPITASMRQHSS
jgi:hypothetical protein